MTLILKPCKQAGGAPLSPVLWAQLALHSQAPRGAMLQPPAHGEPPPKTLFGIKNLPQVTAWMHCKHT